MQPLPFRTGSIRQVTSRWLVQLSPLSVLPSAALVTMARLGASSLLLLLWLASLIAGSSIAQSDREDAIWLRSNPDSGIDIYTETAYEASGSSPNPPPSLLLPRCDGQRDLRLQFQPQSHGRRTNVRRSKLLRERVPRGRPHALGAAGHPADPQPHPPV